MQLAHYQLEQPTFTEYHKMKKPLVRIYTTPTEYIDREMNDDEFTQWQIDQENVAARKVQAEANATAKAALLRKLGITAEEAQLLLS